MKQHRFKIMALTAALSASTLFSVTDVKAATVDDVVNAEKQIIAAGQSSQKRIDKLADEAFDLFQAFKTENKLIENLQVYNAQLERQINDQQQQMVKLKGSIANVTVTERQIPPLTIRMIDGLEQFVNLDLPFSLAERTQRIEQLRNNVGRSDLSVAEKFRQVLEAYTIELEYGKKIDEYSDSISVGNNEMEVNVLRVGRICLAYQTKDQNGVGVWDQNTGEWIELDPSDYRSAMKHALRIAKKQASINVLTLPIKAPEAN
jgi:hypothetical protein